MYPDEWPPLNALANDGDLIGRYDRGGACRCARGSPSARSSCFREWTDSRPYARPQQVHGGGPTRLRVILSVDPRQPVGTHRALRPSPGISADEAVAGREVAWARPAAPELRQPTWKPRTPVCTDVLLTTTGACSVRSRAWQREGNAESAGNTLGYSAVIKLTGRSIRSTVPADATAAAALAPRDDPRLCRHRLCSTVAARRRAAVADGDGTAATPPRPGYTLGMYAPMVRAPPWDPAAHRAADVTSSKLRWVCAATPGQQGPAPAAVPARAGLFSRARARSWPTASSGRSSITSARSGVAALCDPRSSALRTPVRRRGGRTRAGRPMTRCPDVLGRRRSGRADCEGRAQRGGAGARTIGLLWRPRRLHRRVRIAGRRLNCRLRLRVAG